MTTRGAQLRKAGVAFLDGLHSPLEVLSLARSAGPPFVQYRRLVRWQLLLVVLGVVLFSPIVLDGIELVRERPHHTIELGTADSTVVKPKRKKRKKSRSRAEDSGGGADDYSGGDDVEEVTGASFLSAHAPRLMPFWLAIVALYGSWLVIEWLVSALYREHNDRLTEALACAAGLPLRADPRSGLPPRVRLDVRWVMRRFWRQLLGALVFATGTPIFLMAKLVPGAPGRVIYDVVLGAWGLYWLMVTTAAKSDLAWSETAKQRSWYLRVWSTLTTRVPGFRWWLPRAYGRMWAWLTDKMHRAEELVAARPAGVAGVAVIRVLGNLPIVSIFVRPLVPLSASLVLIDPSMREKAGVGSASTP